MCGIVGYVGHRDAVAFILPGLRRLEYRGYDSEVIAHMIERYLSGGLPAAVLRAARDLHGAYAIACIDANAPNTLVALRRGSSPLVVGFGREEMFVASDIPALLEHTRETLVLDD